MNRGKKGKGNQQIQNDSKTPCDQNSESSRLPTLTELLVGFQKSMARVAQLTARASEDDPLFLYGRRNLYKIDEIEVEIPIKIQPDLEEVMGNKFFNKIRVMTRPEDIQAKQDLPNSWGRLKFKVTGKPLKEKLGKSYVFVNLTGYNPQRDIFEIKIMGFDENGDPLKNKTIKLIVSILNSPEDEKIKEMFLDNDGTIRLELDLGGNEIVCREKISGKEIVRFSRITNIANIEYRYKFSATIKDPDVICYRDLIINPRDFRKKKDS